ncbi:MAG: nucleotidyltransferase domain-containing protein [Cyanobacteria bacterium SZAS-4]|nr:nucleotidyltransferase domain-containing protein [Cyanobacteria bacterium SZAS-4]
MKFPDALDKAVANHKFPLIFATVSGAHLYGFPSPDSDYDLRGVHVFPTDELVGLDGPDETIEITNFDDGIELDLVTHDLKKFILLMLKPNGYVLEQLLSPLVVHTTPEHKELIGLSEKCITRYHANHYLGFAHSQWRLFSKEEQPRVKPLLYVFRVVLTGIHLMQTGTIEANLNTLNEKFSLDYLPELIALKQNSKERSTLDSENLQFYEAEFHRLLALLESAAADSKLPESATAKPALNDLLKRVRLGLS